MPDMLVKLYDLPDPGPLVENLAAKGITVRRAHSFETYEVVEWIEETFGENWSSEFGVAFGNRPISCFVASENGKIVGSAVYDVVCRNFFGPLGVGPESQDKGIGRALLLSCLHSLAAEGYAYAIVGSARPPSFYSHAVGAVPIAGT